MKTIVVAVVILILSSLTGCVSTNPLVGPFDTAINVTLGPYVEERLEAELAAGTKNEAFVNAKKLEIMALRQLILEAKGE